MSRQFFVTGVAACLGLLAALTVFHQSRWVYPEIEIDLILDRYESVQIFVDSGAGFLPGARHDYRIKTPGRLNRFTIPLPYESIRQIRIDPFQNSGEIELHRIALGLPGEKRIWSGESLNELLPQAKNFDTLLVSDAGLAATSQGEDPMLILPGVTLERAERGVAMRVVYSLLAGIISGFSVLLIIRLPHLGVALFTVFLVILLVDLTYLTSHTFRVPPNFSFVLLSLCKAILITSGLSLLLSKTIPQPNWPGKTVTRFFSCLVTTWPLLFIGFVDNPAYTWLVLPVAVWVLLFFGGPLISPGRGFLFSFVQRDRGYSQRSRLWFTLGGLILFALLAYFREPSLFLEPRIWAEDGTHALRAIFHNESWTALGWHHEYFRITSNIGALLTTRIFTVEDAGLVFTVVALLVMLLIPAVILTGRSPLWDTPAKKAVACLFVLAAPFSDKIWLNMNGSHYYLAVLAAVLLAEVDAGGGGLLRRCSHRLLLAFSSLGGVLPCLLTPLFLLRFLQVRKREVLIAFGIMSVGTLIQFVLVLLWEGDKPPRTGPPTADFAGWIALAKSVLMIFGESSTQWATDRARTEGWTHAGKFIFVAWLVGWTAVAWLLRRSIALYFVLAGVGLLMFALLFGIGGENQRLFLFHYLGNRYFYASNFLFLIALFTVFGECRKKIGVPIAAFCAFFLATFVVANLFDPYWREGVIDPGLPRWEEEVATWREDPNHVLQLWPKGFRLYLNIPPAW